MTWQSTQTEEVESNFASPLSTFIFFVLGRRATRHRPRPNINNFQLLAMDQSLLTAGEL